MYPTVPLRSQLIDAGLLRPASPGAPRQSAWVLALPCLRLDARGRASVNLPHRRP